MALSDSHWFIAIGDGDEHFELWQPCSAVGSGTMPALSVAVCTHAQNYIPGV